MSSGSSEAAGSREIEQRAWKVTEYQWRFVCTKAPPDETSAHEVYTLVGYPLIPDKLDLYLNPVKRLAGPSAQDVIDVNRLLLPNIAAPKKTYVQVDLQTSSVAIGERGWWLPPFSATTFLFSSFNMGLTPSPLVTIQLSHTSATTRPYYDAPPLVDDNGQTIVDPHLKRASPESVIQCSAKDDVEQQYVGHYNFGIRVHSGTWQNYGWRWALAFYDIDHDDALVEFGIDGSIAGGGGNEASGTANAKLTVREKTDSSRTLEPLKSVVVDMSWSFAIIERSREKVLYKEWRYIGADNWARCSDEEVTESEKNPNWSIWSNA